MSKKHKRKNSIRLLKEMDKQLDNTYDNLQEEIEAMQIKLNMADRKAQKKIRKAMRRNQNLSDYEKNGIKVKVRNELVGKMEKTNFLERIQNVLNDVAPIVILISRMVAALICAILSVDSVKASINPKTRSILDTVYTKAMSIAQ